jgi:type I restriction enzyme M protein
MSKADYKKVKEELKTGKEPEKIVSTGTILDRIFKDPLVKHGLKEFQGTNIAKEIRILEKEKDKFYIHCLKRDKDIMVYSPKKNAPEEIIRQLWLNKLTKDYGYPLDRIEVEKSVQFGREIHQKAADVVVYKKDRITPYIIFELKNPNERRAIEQLKGYLNAEGCEIGIWSNGIDKVILYRPYPKEFSDTLPDIPKASQTIDDLFTERKTLADVEKKEGRSFDLKWVILRMEELVLANAGVDVFNEVFKLIYAKLYDEKIAQERRGGEIEFRKYKDPRKTYEIINDLFKKSIDEWPGTFDEAEKIELSAEHLQICIGLLENILLFGSDLEVIDAAFEYLMPEAAKTKKGQYFTPRHVIRMCVKMLNPKDKEYIIDPACGSGGFLIHAMYQVWKRDYKGATPAAEYSYANKYLFGLDFDDKMKKISQALMLIAGDGRSHIFKLNSLDARDWQGDEPEKLKARADLLPLLHHFRNVEEEKDNQKTFRHFDFPLLLTNPPFAGEIRDQAMLRQYFFSKDKKGHLKNKVERHILFIERCLDFLRSGGRMAIVLPQGILNNINTEYIRNWLFDKARILAVVGLHGNTFKPHTGTKTSVLFLQKWQEDKQSPKDYPIFMAVSKKPGKDNSGKYIYKKDKFGNKLLDEKGRPILEHDLDEVAEGFVKFAKEQGFGFWK